MLGAHIARLYEFDRELRLLVNDAIERVEVAIRASLISATTELWGRPTSPPLIGAEM